MLSSLLCFGVFIGLTILDDEPIYTATANKTTLQLSLQPSKTTIVREAPPVQPIEAAVTPSTIAASAIQASQVKAKPEPKAPQIRHLNLDPRFDRQATSKFDASSNATINSTQGEATVFDGKLRNTLSSDRTARLNRRTLPKSPALSSYRHAGGDEMVKIGNSCARIKQIAPGQTQWISRPCPKTNNNIFKDWKKGIKTRGTQ